MTFGIKLYRCDSLMFYGECDNFFNANPKPSGKAWREYERPLRDNRSHHLRISRTQIEGVAAYELYLYSTPLVTHFADGRTKLMHHESMSSNRFTRNYTNSYCSFHNNLFYIRDHNTHSWHWHKVDPVQGAVVLSPDQTILSGVIPRKRAVLDPKYKKSVAAALKDYSVWKRGLKRLGVMPAVPFMKESERDAVIEDLASRISANDAIDQESFLEIYFAEKTDSGFRTALYSKLGAWTEKEIGTTERPKKHHHSIPNSWMYS